MAAPSECSRVERVNVELDALNALCTVVMYALSRASSTTSCAAARCAASRALPLLVWNMLDRRCAARRSGAAGLAVDALLPDLAEAWAEAAAM